MARKSRKHPEQKSLPPIKTLNTAIYARLSRENTDEVITTQIEICKDYLRTRPSFELVDIYADNGYTGTNFERPEFERLMEDIRNGKINCIICKDLSRFGRNHIATGEYIENIFPFLQVRFVAIADGFDNFTVQPNEYFLTSFKNFAHTYFAMETSRKAITAKRELQEKGLYIGSKAPYGYLKDPSDKHKLIIDPETEPIIKEMFKRYADGDKLKDIAKDLNEKGVVNPSIYSKEKYNWNNRKAYIAQNGKWNTPMIMQLLKNPRYSGVLIQHTQYRSFYQNIPNHVVPTDEQIRIDNGMPAIIDREIWDKVQNRIVQNKIPHKPKERHAPDIFQGVVFCKVCGFRLYRRFEIRGRVNPQIVTVYWCKSCGHHRVLATELEQAVFAVINAKIDEPCNELTADLLKQYVGKIFVDDNKNISFGEDVI